MRESWAQALKYVREDEGGNDDDPADPGGRTSRGITQREYTHWCKLHGSPAGDVWHAPDTTVDQIYHDQYWMPYCDAMPKGIDYLLFDMNVNMGPAQGAKILQRALHTIEPDVIPDGHIGVVTLSAARAIGPTRQLIERVGDFKHSFYKSIEHEHPKLVKFDHGWMRRVDNVQQRAVKLVA